MNKKYRGLLFIFLFLSSVYFFSYFWKDVYDRVDFSNLNKLIKEGKNEEALKILNLYLKSHPKDGMLFYYKALVLKNLEKYDEALAELDKSISIGYPEVLAYDLKSFIYGEYKKDIEKQIYYAEKSIAIDPSNAEAYYLTAMAYKKKGDYNLALENINKAIKNDPEDYDSIYERALILNELGRKKEAAKDLIKFLKKYPNYSEGWYQLYLIYSFLDKKANALYCIDKALKNSPDNILYLTEKAHLEEKIGDYLSALNTMLKVITKSEKENFTENLFFMACQLYRLSGYKEALKYVNKVIEISKEKKAKFYELRGKIYFQLGDVKKAIKDWNEMAKIAPKYDIKRIKYSKILEQ